MPARQHTAVARQIGALAHPRRSRELTLSGARDFEPHQAAAPELAVDLDLGAMRRADRLDDRQSQAGTAVFARARLINPKEAVEYIWQCRARNADASVLHFQRVMGLARHGAQGHDAAARGEANSIVEQVDADLLEPPPIRLHHGRTQLRALKLYAAILRHQPHLFR